MQLKAAFLLLVFSMNIITGLACSAGFCFRCELNNGKANELITHMCCDNFHQTEATVHRQSEGCKDSCCNGQVIKFSRVDKFLPQSFVGRGITLLPTFSSFHNIDVYIILNHLQGARYLARNYHPRISNIRLAIQSFQI